MQGDKAPSLGALLVKLGCLSVLEADEALVHLVATVNTAHTGSCGKHCRALCCCQAFDGPSGWGKSKSG